MNVSDINFAEPQWLYLLPILFLPLALATLYFKWRNKAIYSFADEKFFNDLGIKKGRYPWFIILMCSIALFSGIVALSKPQYGSASQKVKQATGTVMFALDVSNSMNVEDVTPKRLEAAKKIIISTLENTPGMRAGIILFAGNAFSVMPLSVDHEAAQVYLNQLTTDVIKVQGTDFQQPVAIAAQKLKSITSGKVLVILSDGEDNENHLDDAIDMANNEAIKITTVGIGTDKGGPIPYYDFGQMMGYKMDKNGQTVISRRMEDELKKISSKTGGIFIDGNNVEKATQELTEYIRSAANKQEIMVDTQDAHQLFPYFLLLSFASLSLIYLFNPKKDLTI